MHRDQYEVDEFDKNEGNQNSTNAIDEHVIAQDYRSAERSVLNASEC